MNKVTKGQIENLFEEAKKEVKHAVCGKLCLLVVQLKNGFTLVGESACVDPKNYDPDIGYSIAKEKVIDKLWELEGYALQKRLAGDEVTLYDSGGARYKSEMPSEISDPNGRQSGY